MSDVRFIGRYAMHGELASGGMATIHLGRLLGPVGFARTVAIKRLHPQLAKDPQFVAMFVDEARFAARIRHQNVVPTLDVVALEGEIFLVMEYVHGESLSRLLAALEARGERVPTAIAAGIMIGVLHGLQAAHDAKSEKGTPLEIVHRDVSPQNVLVGVDGLPRLVDFGVAKAVDRLQTTGDGGVKGKLGYAAPEQLEGSDVDRRTDIWAAAVVLWEMLAGRRLFAAPNALATLTAVLTREIEAPSRFGSGPPELDAIVLRGLARAPDERYGSASEMADAIERTVTPATPRAIGEWVARTAAETLATRLERVEEMEREGGGNRSSDGSLRRQLAVLGFTDAGAARPASAPPPSSEEPTGQAPGRIRPSDAPTSIAASAPPLAEPSREEDASPPAARAPSPPSRAMLVAVVAALAVAVFVAARRGPSPTEPTTSASAAPPAIVSAPTAPAIASLRPEPAPEADAGAPKPVTTSSVTRPPRPRPATFDAGHARPDCDPPYTVGPGPDFIRVPKTECLSP